ncbi:heparinase II/III family protein [Dyadobacter luticola]|nr:alginate lyase family protein [Dyadobacter luticola]
MGWRYTAFRFWREVQLRTGLLRLRFSTNVRNQAFISIAAWRSLKVNFFFEPDNVQVKRDKSLTDLELNASRISENIFSYFSHKWYHVSDWHTNPETGYTYPKNQHWTKIPDFSAEAGDIKYVWEKSRFTFLYDLIRYDHHFEKDQFQLVFNLIEDWIKENPVNCGPNWKCGQEISLRVLNWLFALYYYKYSENLTQELFNKIISSIQHQMCHVRKNINFSLIAVRNNHALTESLGLYVVGLLLPFFPESNGWKKLGKRLFEQEIAYQIYEDGTFLQFSMNYHRVVVQLLSWAIALANVNGECWSETIFERARKSLQFLRTCQDDKTGRLPNYGNNDGALFFTLASCDFPDFRPQLAALATMLNVDPGYGPGKWEEEAHWLAGNFRPRGETSDLNLSNITSFEIGGYYILRDSNSITFLRCGSYRNRPFQADNMHLDIWVNGENILRDAGCYSYNTDEHFSRYFQGTASHNTAMIGDFDQMKRVSRFIWSGWIEKAPGSCWEDEDRLSIEAEFEGYEHLGKGITHKRKVAKQKGKYLWTIEDEISNVLTGLSIHQIWHPSNFSMENFSIQCQDKAGLEIQPKVAEGWFSDHYGNKEECKRIVFSSDGRFFRTVIREKNTGEF